jgi:hypothetical protein
MGKPAARASEMRRVVEEFHASGLTLIRVAEHA